MPKPIELVNIEKKVQSLEAEKQLLTDQIKMFVDFIDEFTKETRRIEEIIRNKETELNLLTHKQEKTTIDEEYIKNLNWDIVLLKAQKNAINKKIGPLNGTYVQKVTERDSINKQIENELYPELKKEQEAYLNQRSKDLEIDSFIGFI